MNRAAVNRGFHLRQIVVNSRDPRFARLAFQPVPEEKAGRNRLHLDIEVADIESAVAEAVRLGGTRAGEPVRDEQGAFQVMLDPEGNEFCFVHDSWRSRAVAAAVLIAWSPVVPAGGARARPQSSRFAERSAETAASGGVGPVRGWRSRSGCRMCGGATGRAPKW